MPTSLPTNSNMRSVNGEVWRGLGTNLSVFMPCKHTDGRGVCETDTDTRNLRLTAALPREPWRWGTG